MVSVDLPWPFHRLTREERMVSRIRTGIVVVAFGLAGVLGAGASPVNAAVEVGNVTGLAAGAGGSQAEAETASPVWGLHSKHASVVGCNNTGSHLLRQNLISDYFCTIQPDGWWWLMISTT